MGWLNKEGKKLHRLPTRFALRDGCVDFCVDMEVVDGAAQTLSPVELPWSFSMWVNLHVCGWVT